MSAGYLLDTNALSEASKLRPNQQVLDWLRSLPTNEVFLSTISIGEIRKGIELLESGRRREALERWLQRDLLERAPARMLPATQQIAERWGLLTARRQRSGDPLDLADGLIAATALEYNLVLVTRNTRHFSDLHLPLLNPWDGQPHLM